MPTSVILLFSSFAPRLLVFASNRGNIRHVSRGRLPLARQFGYNEASRYWVLSLRRGILYTIEPALEGFTVALPAYAVLGEVNG